MVPWRAHFQRILIMIFELELGLPLQKKQLVTVLFIYCYLADLDLLSTGVKILIHTLRGKKYLFFYKSNSF